MFAKLKKKVLEEGEAGGPERLGFSPRKLPGGAVAVRSPPEVVAAASVGGDEEVDGVKGEGEGGEGEKEVETKTEEAKPLLLQSIDLVRTLNYLLLYYVTLCPFAPSIRLPFPPTCNPVSHKKQSTRSY